MEFAVTTTAKRKHMDKPGEEQPKNPMTKAAAARIQRAEAKQQDGGVKKGGFAPRAQSAADKHENEKKN